MEYLESIKKILEALGIWYPVITGINIFVPTLAMVYLFGRMLGVAKKTTTKNLIAAITAFISSALYLTFSKEILFNKIWNIYFIGCIVIIIYVLIGFTLFERVNNALDKVAPDEEPKKKK